MNNGCYLLLGICAFLVIRRIIKWCLEIVREAKYEKQAAERARYVSKVYGEAIKERQARESEARERAILEAKELALAKAEEKRLKQEAAERKAEFNERQSKKEFSFLQDRLAEQYALLDSLLLEQAGTVAGSKQFNKIQQRIMTLNNQIHLSEMKFNKAVFTAKEIGKGKTA